ncbi:MAG: isopeptide-forming domain-containing fimbrial protein [Ruminococcaceae bacterium]|nr:isopeptide-forming domain-containing fimbrial protein [Oscillospiraceae bacterium]
MKKFLSLLTVVMLIMTLAIPVSAAGEGSVTINGVGTDATYEIYKLLDLESYSTESGAYSYKVNSAWTGFFATAEALTYVSIDEAGYVTWKGAEDADTIAAFAKIAFAYAKANGIAAVKSSKNAGEFVITTNSETGITSGKFEGLELGYYLVDSTMGALCGLTTTNPNAYINAKNGIPTIDKQVQEDSTGQWADQNTADIGQTVNFRTTISVHAGAENFILHDKMSAGLTYKQVSRVELLDPSTGVTTVLTPDDDYTVKTEGLTGGCTFEVEFSKELCDSLETNNKLIVYYEAMLNRNAIVSADGNPNEAWLEYGEEHTTTHDQTKTYTFGIDIVKTDSQNTLITGAKFKIYDAATGGNEIKVVLMDDGVTYRRAREDETGVEIAVEGGKVRIVGFDNGTYYLEETVAPDGYNKLTARQRFIIADGNLDSVFNNGVYSSGSGVHVVNKTGSMLPETGGFGTTMFILIGGLMVLGAGVVLVSKKRLAKVAE